MPRAARVQYEGAQYHILNRGNYRKDITVEKKSAPWKLARMSHYRAKRHLAIREAMRGKGERDPRRERAGARNQADRSDNAASRACRFEVSAERV